MAAACTLELYVDDQRLEQTIRDGIEAQVHVAVTRVDCPDQHRVAGGDVFACTVDTADGRHLTIIVTQEGNGNMRWDLTGGS